MNVWSISLSFAGIPNLNNIRLFTFNIKLMFDIISIFRFYFEKNDIFILYVYVARQYK